MQPPTVHPTQQPTKAEYTCGCGFTVTVYKPYSIKRYYKKGQRVTVQQTDLTYEYEPQGFLRNEIRYSVDTTYDVTFEALRDFFITKAICPICDQITTITKPNKPYCMYFIGPSAGWKLIKKTEVNRKRTRE